MTRASRERRSLKRWRGGAGGPPRRISLAKVSPPGSRLTKRISLEWESCICTPAVEHENAQVFTMRADGDNLMSRPIVAHVSARHDDEDSYCRRRPGDHQAPGSLSFGRGL